MKKLILFGALILILASCQEKKAAPEKKEAPDVESLSVQEVDNPAQDKGAQPFLLSDGDQLMMSWTEKVNGGLHAVRFARFDGDQWTGIQDLARASDFFVNWADFPAISKNGKQMIAHVLQKSDTATFAYDIKYVHSVDEGQTWSALVTMHEDSTKTEHGFVSYAPDQKGFIWVSWLDGRHTGGQGHGQDDGHGGEGAMQLRAGLVNAEGHVVSRHLVDDRTCDCCQTAMTMTAEGPLVAYRDRSESEVRDIYTSLFVDGRWTNPAPVANDHWEINGCPVNGPALGAMGETVALSWFSAAENRPKVQVAFSENSGRSFKEPLRLDHGKAIGRVDLLMVDQQRTLVSWMEGKGEEAVLMLALVGADGRLIKDWEVAELSSSRSSGFPRMVAHDGHLFIAWNDRMQREQGIKMVKIPYQDIIP